MLVRCFRPAVAAARFAPPANIFSKFPLAAVPCSLESLIQSACKATLARDPDRPKLPSSAYFRFSAEYRLKQGLKGGKESMKQSGSAWKGLPQMQKAPYEKAYAEEHAAYQKAFKEYVDAGKLDAWKRDPMEPKRPLNPYFQWAQEQRKQPQYANVKSVAEVSKLLKPQWDQVPAAQKEALTRTFKTEQEVYKQKLAEYNASPGRTAWLEKTGRLEQIKKTAAQKAKLVEAKEKEAGKKKLAKEKEAAKKAAAAEKQRLEKAKERKKIAAEKEKAGKIKEAQKEKLAKEKEQAAQEKRKLAEANAKEAEKAKARKAKEVAKKAAEKDKLAKMKEKEKEKKAKAMAASKAKAKSKAAATK